MIDESEVLTPADDEYHTDKRDFASPFVCGARDLPEALRRIREGAAMIRTKGEAGTGDVNQAVKHQRTIKKLRSGRSPASTTAREKWAREHGAPVTWSTRPPRPVASPGRQLRGRRHRDARRRRADDVPRL